MNDDNFSETPTTIGEARAAKSGRPDHWTPREVLVRLLRMIDAGEENPSQIVIIYVPDAGETPERETNGIAVMNSSKGVRDLLGMISLAEGLIRSPAANKP